MRFSYSIYSVSFFISFLILTSCATKDISRDIPSTKDTVLITEIKDGPERKKTITISAVGDIMLGTYFPSEDYLPPNGGDDLLKNTEDYLKQTDITFGNLEGSLSDTGELLKKCSNPKKCYAFKMPEAYALLLKKAGFNLLSIANNHINDFGIDARENTINTLKTHSIHFAGVDAYPIALFKQNGIKIGFCAFSPNKGVPDFRNIEAASKTVSNLAEHSDIVIVSFHGGAEGADRRHITRESEFFFGEDRGSPYDFAHRLIDAGADIILGHGPHITRGIELYKERFITYSMGNFCTYARFNLRGLNGIAPLFQITLDTNGVFLSGKIIPLHQEFKKGPSVDSEKRAIKEIVTLTKKDFPETPLIIKSDGTISRR